MATAGGVPRRLVEGGSPVWLDDARLLVSIEHEIETVRTTRLTVVNVADPFPRRLARDHEGLDALGDEEDARVSPDGSEVAYVFVPRGDLRRAEIRVVDVVTGRVRALTGTPEMADRGPASSPDGATIAYISERSGRHEVHAVSADGDDDRQVTHDDADFSQLAWHREGTRIAAVRGRRNRFDLVLVDPSNGAVEQIAPGGAWDDEEQLVAAALARSGLRPPERFFGLYPYEISGGQRQRVVIAGAMVLNPELLVADEPVSSLDASVRGEILQLMLGLVRDTGIAILVVTHDLGWRGTSPTAWP